MKIPHVGVVKWGTEAGTSTLLVFEKSKKTTSPAISEVQVEHEERVGTALIMHDASGNDGYAPLLSTVTMSAPESFLIDSAI